VTADAATLGAERVDARQAWLVKTEPDVFGFEDLWRRSDRTTPWDGIRNYQARNYLRDAMRVGDVVVVYHSSATPPGAAGLAVVASAPYPDQTQFDPASPYHDPDSPAEAPRWWAVDVQATARLPRLVPLAELRADPVLAALDLALLRRGNRLSVMPLPLAAVDRIEALARGGADAVAPPRDAPGGSV
jgi:predicted RNA-binding protein with PUA-like domain